MRSRWFRRRRRGRLALRLRSPGRRWRRVVWVGVALVRWLLRAARRHVVRLWCRLAATRAAGHERLAQVRRRERAPPGRTERMEPERVEVHRPRLLRTAANAGALCRALCP